MAFDEDAAEAVITLCHEHGYLDVRDEGMIGGLIQPLFFSPSELIGVELAWWSEAAGTGKALREGFEAWAKAQGARWVQASALADANERAVRRLYARAGYEAAEVAFRKRL